MELSDFQLIIGSDMNAVVDHTCDKSKVTNYNFRSSHALQHLLSDFNLIDTWRAYNPGIKEFTFYSNRHQSFSRIDFIFISPLLFSSVKRIEIRPMSLSDHHALFCQFTFSQFKKKATRWRFNCTLLENPAFCSQFQSELHHFLVINRNSVNDFRILWDAVKGFIRNNTTAFASGLNKSNLKKDYYYYYIIPPVALLSHCNLIPQFSLHLLHLFFVSIPKCSLLPVQYYLDVIGHPGFVVGETANSFGGDYIVHASSWKMMVHHYPSTIPRFQ